MPVATIVDREGREMCTTALVKAIACVDRGELRYTQTPLVFGLRLDADRLLIPFRASALAKRRAWLRMNGS